MFSLFRHSILSVDIFVLICDYLQNDAAETLSKFYYPPVAAVSVSYPKEAIRKECLIDGELRGFGQLHPRSQGVETLGTVSLLLSLRIVSALSLQKV